MAIPVRQSVYHRDQWMPIAIPSFGRGNDDFMALDPIMSSVIQDEFAICHRIDNMEALLEETFVIGNTLPDDIKEKRLRNIPVGLIYIDMEMWKSLRPKIIKSLYSFMDWTPQERAGEEWAASFINAVQEQDKSSEMFVRAGLDPHPLNGFKHDILSKWGQVSKHSTISDWISSWSEHCTLFSLDAYFPVALKYAREVLIGNEAGPSLANLVEFFDGVETLMLLNKAFQMLRQDWAPKSMIQEYNISPLHDEVAKLVRKKYRAEAVRRKELDW